MIFLSLWRLLLSYISAKSSAFYHRLPEEFIRWFLCFARGVSCCWFWCYCFSCYAQSDDFDTIQYKTIIIIVIGNLTSIKAGKWYTVNARCHNSYHPNHRIVSILIERQTDGERYISQREDTHKAWHLLWYMYTNSSYIERAGDA